MNTPAHMALGLALLGRRRKSGDWWAILAGSILPDLFLFVQYYERATPDLLILIFNSVPVYVALLLAAWLGKARWLLLIAAAALLHIALDLPLHAGDAHRHFWPLSDFRYISPVSFWDHDHHGKLFGFLEGVLFIACFGVIWKRLRNAFERLLALVFAAIYAATFIHFLGHAFADQHWAVW